MVQGTVKLDMLEGHSEIVCECLEGAYLIENDVDDLIVCHFYLTPAKTSEVRISRMGTCHNIVIHAQTNCFLHCGRIGRMQTAGNVRRRNVLDHPGIVADRICSIGFAHVAVEVHCIHADIVASFHAPVITDRCWRCTLSFAAFTIIHGFCYVVGAMAPGKTRQPAKRTDAEKARAKRFIYLWVPIICLVIIGVYASALDPMRPTGRVIKGSVMEIKRSSQQPMSVLYKIRLETGEEVEIAVPEKSKPAGSQVMVEEFSTALLKKKRYEIKEPVR